MKESKIIIEYKIRHGKDGWIRGVSGKYSFASAEEALKEATLFKENPRVHNHNMTDENVDYWKSQSFSIVKEISIIEEITTV